MSREILFRGKRLEIGAFAAESVREWAYGGYAKDYSGVYIYDTMRAQRMVKVAPETVCQYTGYTDLHKKKAFEHDIVFYEDGQCHGYIVFKNGCFFIEWEDGRSDLRRDIHFWFTERRVYVVGNMFENPELLNQ